VTRLAYRLLKNAVSSNQNNERSGGIDLGQVRGVVRCLGKGPEQGRLSEER
jgi:hypothetical protein